MASYLLLRDNKESGPFSVEDLRKTGLKPYDLIWIEGKSAAWRYPSEVEELKPFAPVVEEQPFDRFFKKTEPESNHSEPVIKAEPPVKEEHLKYAPIQKEEPVYTPKRSVFVTLPNQKQVIAERPVPVKTEPAKPVVAAPVISVQEAEPEIETKYSRPLDEIKEMYVRTLHDRKSRIAQKGIWLGRMKKVAVIAALITGGVLIGLAIQSNGKNDPVDDNIVKSNAAVTNTSITQPGVEDQASPYDKLIAEPQPAGIRNSEEAASNNNETISSNDKAATLKIRKETMVIVPKQRPRQQVSFETREAITPTSTVNGVTGERSRKTRNENEIVTGGGAEEKAVTSKTNKNSLRDLVSVSSNDYKIVAFGGIRNLFLTVTNNSKYELDHVIVELQYLKPSEEPLRTENINFKSIAANSSATLRIPDTNRGIKVSYRIINIDSKQSAGDVAGRY